MLNKMLLLQNLIDKKKRILCLLRHLLTGRLRFRIKKKKKGMPSALPIFVLLVILAVVADIHLYKINLLILPFLVGPHF